MRNRNDAISIDSPCMIAVALKETNEMIGEIVVKPKDNTISLGYTFSYKYHRQGYAFEVLTVLHEHLHKMAPEWEFISFTECQNIASIELLKKLGYKDLGYVPSMDSQAFGKWTTLVTEGTPNKETVSAMLEAERIAKNPNVKGYHDVDELFADLDK